MDAVVGGGFLGDAAASVLSGAAASQDVAMVAAICGYSCHCENGGDEIETNKPPATNVGETTTRWNANRAVLATAIQWDVMADVTNNGRPYALTCDDRDCICGLREE